MNKPGVVPRKETCNRALTQDRQPWNKGDPQGPQFPYAGPEVEAESATPGKRKTRTAECKTATTRYASTSS